MIVDLVLPFALALGPASSPAKKGAESPIQGAVIERESQPVHVIAEGKGGARILLDETTAPGLKEAAMTELLMLPGTTVPEHLHERSAELIYVLEGRGKMTLGERIVEVKPGMAIYIPAGMKHSLRLETKIEPLRAIQVYTPGGPEQRFKSGPESRE
jgi:putative monooxygenase